ncbi:MAG: hypothetical protein UV42_C0032G0001, partial [Candidatus Magasanikbacteria bacterium GW2011_GWE2_42_7]
EDGEIKEYKWVQGGSTISVNDTLETSYLKSGTQTIELVITDNKGETRSEQLDIRIYSKSFLLFLGLFITILLILAFYIIFTQDARTLFFDTKSAIRPDIRVPLKDADPMEVRFALQAVLDEDLEKEEPFSDRAARRWKMH